jgi:DNA-binding response OmpR family regulator
MLTARDAVDDRVRGLEAGADDYLVKPFAFRELVARIRALTRRHQPPRSSLMEVGELRLDSDAWAVTVRDQPASLTPKEFAVLELLMQNAGRLLTRSHIEEHVWDYDLQTDSNLLEVYIARLRRKLAGLGATDVITTIRGAGYRLESDPSCVPTSGAPASA